MQFTTLLALAPLALAAPLAPRQSNAFTVISARSASPVHLLPFVVREGGVFLSGDSSTYCPEGSVDCSSYSNITAFGAQDGAPVDLGLNTGVPGGQLAYIAADGAIGYTLPHSASIPEGATLNAFGYEPAQGESSFGYLSPVANGANGFVACQKTEGSEYQVFANIEGQDFSNCLGIDALTSVYSGAPAWEFTG